MLDEGLEAELISGKTWVAGCMLLDLLGRLPEKINRTVTSWESQLETKTETRRSLWGSLVDLVTWVAGCILIDLLGKRPEKTSRKGAWERQLKTKAEKRSSLKIFLLLVGIAGIIAVTVMIATLEREGNFAPRIIRMPKVAGASTCLDRQAPALVH